MTPYEEMQQQGNITAYALVSDARAKYAGLKRSWAVRTLARFAGVRASSAVVRALMGRVGYFQATTAAPAWARSDGIFAGALRGQIEAEGK